MSGSRLDAYLSALHHALTRRGGVDISRLISEAREHLADAIEIGVQRGLSIEAAEDEAFASFGTPQTIADSCAERPGMWRRALEVLRGLGGMGRHEPIAMADVQVHDVRAKPFAYHFCVKRRRRGARANPAGAFDLDPRDHLARFLRTFGPRTLGPDGILESLTVLDDGVESPARGTRYLASFSGGARMIWTVHASARTISMDGTHAM